MVLNSATSAPSMQPFSKPWGRARALRRTFPPVRQVRQRGIVSFFLPPLFAALVLAGLTGCVSATKYRGAEDERNALGRANSAQAEKIARLEAQEENLSNELALSLEGFEDLYVEHHVLQAEAAKLRRANAGLSKKVRVQSKKLLLAEQDLTEVRSEVSRLASTYTTLMADLEAEVSSGQIEIEQLREGIRVSVSDDIIFASGSAELDPVGRQVLEKVTRQLLSLEYSIEVQGHTDDRALKSTLVDRFPSNWELAAARASRVVRLMQEKGIPGERLRVVSLASYEPLAPNDSSENRAQNRRIEIRLKPKPGAPAADSRSAKGN